MAAVLPEATRSAFAASYIMDLESMFDLDTVLTGADDYYNDQIITEPPSVVVADLPTVVTDDVCAVCMEEFRADEGGKQIPCGHVYHQTCISSWLSVGGDCCPLCRCHVSSDNKSETAKPVQV